MVAVNTIFDSMRETMEKGERIEIRGFESFMVRKYGAYKGRNFKVGKELKEKVNNMKGQEDQKHSVE